MSNSGSGFRVDAPLHARIPVSLVVEAVDNLKRGDEEQRNLAGRLAAALPLASWFGGNETGGRNSDDEPRADADLAEEPPQR